MLRKCADAGTPVSAAVIVVSAQAAAHVKALSPKTYTVVRPIWPDYYPMRDGRVRFSQEWFESYLSPVRPWLQHIDAVQFVNEMWVGNSVGDHRLTDLRDFYTELIRASRAAGTRCTVLDLAVGNMSDARFAPEPDQFGVMKPMLEYAAREGCPLVYHCYNGLTPQGVYNPLHDPETWVLRPVYWLERVPGLKCVGGEALVPEWADASGHDAVLPGDSADVVRMMRQVDQLWTAMISGGRITQDQWVGFCPFTDNPGERWKTFNMNPHLAAQAEYLING